MAARGNGGNARKVLRFSLDLIALVLARVYRFKRKVAGGDSRVEARVALASRAREQMEFFFDRKSTEHVFCPGTTFSRNFTLFVTLSFRRGYEEGYWL